jgi:hypothetical protein
VAEKYCAAAEKPFSKFFSHRGHREHRDMEAENGREFDPALSKQVPQAFVFSFRFLNVNPSAASVITRSA